MAILLQRLILLQLIPALAFLALAAPYPSPATSTPNTKREAQVIPNKYIVTLKPGVGTGLKTHLNWVADVHKRSLLSRRSAEGTTGVDQVYDIKDSDFTAYSGSFDEETIREIEASGDVASVEQDKIWHLYDSFPSFSSPGDSLQAAAPYFHPRPKPKPRQKKRGPLTTQTNAPWGLASISHKSLPLPTNATSSEYEYIYDPLGSGLGTYAYVIDTGILTSHKEFEGRAVLGYNAFPDSEFVDNQGHGTHTAGTIGSRKYGVAKKATLVSIKVFDWDGSSTSIVLSGYTWAVNNITSSGYQSRSVISMSLGGPFSEVFNSAVSSAYSLGVISVVAAGNDGIDALEVSPASCLEAITVGAIDGNYTRPWWSNFGNIVDIFAPGVDVLSCWNGFDEDELVLEGTSMATPHVAGLVLYLRQIDPEGNQSVEDLVKNLKKIAVGGVVKDEGEGSPNLLAYNGNGA